MSTVTILIFWRAFYNASYSMITKPIRAKELHYPMIQFLIISIIVFFGEGGWGGGEPYRYMQSNLSSVIERC